jgi:hypothetical protein
MLVDAFRRRATLILEFIGRHPTWILVLPSCWMFGRFSPFWKDIDAFQQLLTPAWGGNILHSPPIYCFAARIPFWLVDKLISGSAPGIFEEQRPSLAAVLTLLLLQHAGLWAALRYFLFSVRFSNLNRGIATLLLASVASLYVFAHTCGSDATTCVTWFLAFGGGLRILTTKATWQNWIVYVAAVTLALGSRHINGVLLAWLPLASLILIVFQWAFPKSNRSISIPRQARIAGTAILLCGAVLAFEHSLVAWLCQRFKVIEQSTTGVTLSDRIATWITLLSAREKDQLLAKVSSRTADANVRLAIASQIKVGSYHNGTDRVIKKALEEEGLPTERIQAESDKVMLQASICFYESTDLLFITVILKEFAKGWAPTSDYRIALSGPLETFRFASYIQRDSTSWSRLPRLPMFDVQDSHVMLKRAEHDWFFLHWQGVPILIWSFLFGLVAISRFRRGSLPLDLLLIGLAVLVIGAATYAATCLCVYSTPRYVLPLLVSVFAFGSIIFSGDSGTEKGVQELQEKEPELKRRN